MSANDMNPRTAREAQQQKEAHRSNILYGTIGVLFVLLAVAVFVWKSNVIQKHATAATLYYSAEAASADGSSSASSSSAAGSSSSSSSTAEKTKLADVSVPQVSYYFTNIYHNFVQQNSSYISYLGLDTSKDLRGQTYPGGDNQSWFDYFMAPAAYDSISAFLQDTKTKPTDFDLILTGDLGELGHSIVQGFFERDGVDMSPIPASRSAAI